MLSKAKLLCGGLAVVALGAALSGRQGDYPPLLDDDRPFDAPFSEGEELRFEVRWKPPLLPSLKAGEVSLKIKEGRWRDFETFQITGEAVSGGALASLFGLEVRDRYLSHIDRRTFRSYRVESQIRHGKRMRDILLTFDYAQNLAIREITDLEQQPPEIERQETSGLPGPVIDVLSVFYVTRLPKLKVGDHFLIDLHDNGKFKKVPVVVKSREEVSTGVGKFESLKLETEGGFFGDGRDFTVWYSTGENRFPVRFKADAPLGNIWGSLIAAKTPQMIKKRIRVN